MDPIVYVKETSQPSINLNQLNIQLKNLYTETMSIYQKCQKKPDEKYKSTYTDLFKKYKQLHTIKDKYILKYNLNYTPLKKSNSFKSAKSLNKYIQGRDSFSKMLDSTK
tara:strand:- start:218 stop:544 length:327 start_codon:yes stop_codon:yes gene_type:complete